MNIKDQLLNQIHEIGVGRMSWIAHRDVVYDYCDSHTEILLSQVHADLDMIRELGDARTREMLRAKAVHQMAEAILDSGLLYETKRPAEYGGIEYEFQLLVFNVFGHKKVFNQLGT